ncbi:hypothetical protein F4777DRAFT_444398 [Nemania sp. FL0916]|nr:hypothetical protein F4777DRAFT_444398 [Nemania sp. FL0916]
MALLGWSLILASVVYVAIWRPPFIETAIALCRGYPRIQQPPSTGSPSRANAADGPVNKARSSSASLARRQDAPVTTAETDRSPMGNAASSPPSSEVSAARNNDVPAIAIASSPTTPKATPKDDGAIPSFSLSPSATPDPPASAAAVARGNAGSSTRPPTLSAPAMMPPPPRPPRLRNTPANPSSSSSSSLLAAPSVRPSPLPNRQAQYDRQPGTSTLAPPPTHSSKPPKPSRKVTLEPGHSPLDWARLANHPASDLRGLGPNTPYLRVTPSMLRAQTGRRGKDAWTALGGRVYNISPYLPFHPGGAPELLRAAARDGTALFGEIHPWVNYETMLSSCLVGILVDEAEAEADKGAGDLEAMD